MATLHIEHAITDLETWLTAFNGFAEARHGAGVRAERIRQPVDPGPRACARGNARHDDPGRRCGALTKAFPP
jgi:hypothetical protein